MLMQDKKVITYALRQLKPHEKKHPVHDLELAIVILELKLWRHYLFGEKSNIYMQEFEVYLHSKRTQHVTKVMVRVTQEL